MAGQAPETKDGGAGKVRIILCICSALGDIPSSMDVSVSSARAGQAAPSKAVEEDEEVDQSVNVVEAANMNREPVRTQSPQRNHRVTAREFAVRPCPSL